MATKSYSKHKEYKEFSSRGNMPYTDEQFDMVKSDLMPKSKLDSLGRKGHGAREYHYEYKEEKHPSGKYDRKDLHTVEEYTIPPKSVPRSNESSSYYYEREDRELPAITNSSNRTYNYDSSVSSTPGYSKVKSSKVTKEVSQNVDELDSLLDDLQKDQERQLYKTGYTSDTAESSSFDYRKGTPAKAPSSGYSTLKKEERIESSSWGSSPPPTIGRQAELRQEMYREEKTESRVVPSQVSPAISHPVPAPVCAHCHQLPNTGTLSRSGTPMNKVTTTVKTYTYEVPADQDPTTVPLPPVASHEHSYLSTNENIRSSSTTGVPASPSLGCQYCSHCNSRVSSTRVYSHDNHLAPAPPTTHHYHISSTTDDRTNERILYPKPANEIKVPLSDPYPHNGHGPNGPTSYKFSETTYSSHNTTERFPPSGSPAPFPRPHTPSPSTQQPPKKLDELLADFPEAKYPSQPDGVTRRKVEVTHESQTQKNDSSSKPTPVIGNTRNVTGPAIYYPPGHTPFAKKEVAGYQASAAQGGGAYASGRGMYEYEAGSKSKEKHSEKKTAVPICLPMCCAMPCVIM